jgi:putative transposase
MKLLETVNFFSKRKRSPKMNRINSQVVSQLHLAMTSHDVQKLLLERAKTAVLTTAVELMEQDMEMLCGKPFVRKSDGELCHRGGSEWTSLMVDGAKLPVKRPRARKDGEEVDLPSLAKLRDRELLDSQMLSRILNGVATRKYEAVINGFAEKTGVSKSAVSRAFKRASKLDLEKINGADLSEHRFVALLVDGTGVGDKTHIIAFGVTADSRKVPLGLKEGNTENAEVVKDLLASIRDRNFTLAAGRLLIVIDGGKALRAAVKALWGDSAVIQRCWLHKLRNIRDYIPEVNHGQLFRRMKKLMGLNSPEAALGELRSLRDWLSTIGHDAVVSLDEAGDELLTVHELGITGKFRNCLSSTNLIESLIGVTKYKMRNVKNWKYHPKTGNDVSRDKALRWVASAIESHRPKMRRLVGGDTQMKILINKLNELETLAMPA